MHWRAYWWGTEIVSDNVGDETFLKQLAGKLDRKPIVTYEHGKLEKNDSPYRENNFSYCPPGGGFTLTFNR